MIEALPCAASSVSANRHVKVGARMCCAGIRINGAREPGPTVQDSGYPSEPVCTDMGS